MASSTPRAIPATKTHHPGPTTPGPADTLAFARLPTELLLDVFSLCEASSFLPATCRALSTGFFNPGAQPHRIWSHRHIFLDPQYDHNSQHGFGSLVRTSQGLNAKHEAVAQSDSIVAYYLKSRLPIAFGQEQHPLAAGMAPPVLSNGVLPDYVPPPSIASVFNRGFVDWLFSSAGPFRRRVGADEVDVAEELKQLRAAVGIDFELDPNDELDTDVEGNFFAYHQVSYPEDPEDADDSYGAVEAMEAVYNENGGLVEDVLAHEDEEVDEGDGDADSDDDSVSSSSFSSSASLVSSSICVQRAPTVRKWRLIPDAFLLAHFFIRTSQLDMLERILNHLHSTVPTIATATAPFSVWSHAMLDNRSALRFCVSRIVRVHKDPVMSYPIFLCFLSLVDWSKPAIDVILRVFGGSFDESLAANFVTSNWVAFKAATCTMHQLTSPPSASNRVLDILDWFQQHDAQINVAHFPTISPYIKSSYAIFADVFLAHDVPNLPRVSSIIHRFRLGSIIATWVSKGHFDLVRAALENNVLEESSMGKLLYHTAAQGEELLVAALAEKLASGKRDLNRVMSSALHAADSDKHSNPKTYTTILNMLAACRPQDMSNPTYLIFHNAGHWSPDTISTLLFGCPSHGLRFAWDYGMYLREQLEWIASSMVYMTVFHKSTAIYGRLLDLCVADGFDWGSLSWPHLAAADAMCLIALYRDMQLGKDLDKARAMRPLEQSRVAAVATLAEATVARMREANRVIQHGDGGASVLESFSRSIPEEHVSTLQRAIANVTSFTPSEPTSAMTTSDANQDRHSALDVFLDTLILLDRDFVLKSIPWTSLATVRYWNRFEPDQVARYVTPNRAVRMAQSAMEEPDKLAMLINVLPIATRTSDRFVHGLSVMMQKGPDSKSAIVCAFEQGGWVDWKVHFDGVAQVHCEEYEEGEEEEEEETWKHEVDVKSLCFHSY